MRCVRGMLAGVEFAAKVEIDPEGMGLVWGEEPSIERRRHNLYKPKELLPEGSLMHKFAVGAGYLRSEFEWLGFDDDDASPVFFSWPLHSESHALTYGKSKHTAKSIRDLAHAPSISWEGDDDVDVQSEGLRYMRAMCSRVRKERTVQRH